MRLVLVGRVAGAFGVRGELRITPYTADPEALLEYRTLVREDGGAGLTLTSGRLAGNGLVARAAEVDTRDAAEGLKGLGLYIERSRLPEPVEEDEYYLADLIGLTATSPAGEALGRIKSVQNFGAGDLLEVAPADVAASWWVPFTREAVPEVRLSDGVVVVVPPVAD